MTFDKHPVRWMALAAAIAGLVAVWCARDSSKAVAYINIAGVAFNLVGSLFIASGVWLNKRQAILLSGNSKDRKRARAVFAAALEAAGTLRIGITYLILGALLQACSSLLS